MRLLALMVLCGACTPPRLDVSPQISSGQSALGVGGYVLLDSSFRVEKWTSTDSSVLAVEPNGNSAKVIARSPGTASIFATGEAEAAIELRVADLDTLGLKQDVFPIQILGSGDVNLAADTPTTLTLSPLIGREDAIGMYDFTVLLDGKGCLPEQTQPYNWCGGISRNLSQLGTFMTSVTTGAHQLDIQIVGGPAFRYSIIGE